MAKARFVDAFATAFEAYAAEGLAEAVANKAKKFRVSWADAPFFTRAFNLARYADDAATPYDGALDLPNFPNRAIAALRKASGQRAAAFFEDDEGTPIDKGQRGWDAAFDSSGIEAGMWVKLMIDDHIRATERRLQAQHEKLRIELCGHDGQIAFWCEHYVDEIRQLRKDRGYKVPVRLVTDFLAIFAAKPDPTWVKAAKSI